MIYFPSDCNGWSSANPKPGARNFIQVSHAGAGSQGFGLSLTAFPGHRQLAGWEVGLLGLELWPIQDPGTFKARTLAARLLCQDARMGFKMTTMVIEFVFKTAHFKEDRRSTG